MATYTITQWFDTVTTSAVTDLSSTNKLATAWQSVGVGIPMSATLVWPATGTPIGTIGIEFTNEESPVLSTTGDDYTISGLSPAPVQPAGTASRMPLYLISPGDRFRLTYLKTSGGTGATLTAYVAIGA